MRSSQPTTIDNQVQTSFDSLEEELRKLREDKEILEGKIRGYLTLSEICHEYKEELKKLQAEYKKLLQKEQMKAKHLYSESPAPENDLDRHNGPDFEQRTSKTLNPSSTDLPKNIEIATELTRDKQIHTSELFDQEPANTPQAGNDLSQNTLSLISDPEKSGHSVDKYPMQESITGEEALMHHGTGGSHPSRSLTGLGLVLSSSGEMMLGQSAANFKPGEIQEIQDLMNFSLVPPLNSKEINQKRDDELETVLRSVREIEDPSLGEKVTAIVNDYTKKTSTTISRLLKANAVLIDKNNELEKKLQMTKKDYELVMVRIRKLEQEKYELSPSRSKTPDEASGWVHVKKVDKGETQESAELSQEDARRLEQLQLHPGEKTEDLKWLQTHYRQLREANERWSEEWDKLKYHYDQRLKDVEDERDRLEKDLMTKTLLEETRQRDFERALSELREKASDEEKGKEEALLQLTTCNNRLEQMQKQISELSDKTATLRREKQAKDSEITVLRQGINPTRAAPSETTRSGGKSVEALKTENAVMQQQLVVFQEDFERERQDRATAQSLKDDYKKQNESLKKRVRHMEKNNATIDTQLKMAEETKQRTLVENERLHQELSELKNQLRRQDEERNRNMMAAPYYPQAHQPIVQSAGLHQPMYGGGGGGGPQMHQQYMAPHPQQQQYGHMQMQQQFPAAGGYMATSGSQAAPAPPPSSQALAGNQYTPATPRPRATEHLPGSWSCNQCTYVNYPGRTVCEMCGYIQSPTTQNNFRYPAGGSDILSPRGEENQQQRPAPAFPQYNYQNMGQNIAPNTGNRAV